MDVQAKQKESWFVTSAGIFKQAVFSLKTS
jgi:hypothetical protein